MKVINIVGARPNFMKIAPIVEEMNKYPDKISQILLHTGQHYDNTMSQLFFQDLGITQPDVYLGVGSRSHAEQTARIMVKFEKVCIREMPDLILVVGDVNSTLACSIIAAKLCIAIAHVEAGLRSFDRTMPEEINRLVTDALSEYLFTSCEDANENLMREGIPKEKIYFVGNVMIDTLLKYREESNRSRIFEKLGLNKNSRAKPYALLTLHRPSNVDDRKVFRNILEVLRVISREIPIIFPAHPRTKKQIKLFGYEKYFSFMDLNSMNSIGLKNSINLLDPLSYLEFLNLISNAKIVLTDSGGIQEETTVLGIPCLTLRENTERPVTVRQGTNIIVGTNKERIITETFKILNGQYKIGSVPPLWDGKAAQRIVRVLFESS